MQKEKVIYKGESRVVRIDEKQRKYILYDHKKVYLDKKGGNPFALPPSSPLPPPPPSRVPASSGRQRANFSASARNALGSATKKIIEETPFILNAASAALSAKSETDENQSFKALLNLKNRDPPK